MARASKKSKTKEPELSFSAGLLLEKLYGAENHASTIGLKETAHAIENARHALGRETGTGNLKMTAMFRKIKAVAVK